MPLYNKRPFVGACFRSVLAQHYPPERIVVVDDGSTDGGSDELAGIDDPRLVVLTQTNAGVSAARNAGIRAAGGDWIALIDADDLWTPEHLSELASVIRTCPNAGLVATAIIEYRHDMPDLSAAADQPGGVRKIDYLSEAVANGRIVTASSVALRRQAIEAVNGFSRPTPGEDIDCWVRIALKWPVAVSDRPTAVYRRNTGGAMDAWSKPLPPGQKARRIASLQDFGGTVAVLDRALRTGRYEPRRRVFECYMDARILSNARRTLAVGDPSAARTRLRFMHDRRTRGYRTHKALAMIPRTALLGGIALFRRMRGLVRV